MDELKGNVRNLDRKKVRQALEKELNLKELKKNEYTYLSLASAERGHTSNTISNNVTFQFLQNQDS